MNSSISTKQGTKPRAIGVQSPVLHRFIGGVTPSQRLPITCQSPAGTPPISTQLTAISGKALVPATQSNTAKNQPLPLKILRFNALTLLPFSLKHARCHQDRIARATRPLE